jgi:hypothetical protein
MNGEGARGSLSEWRESNSQHQFGKLRFYH